MLCGELLIRAVLDWQLGAGLSSQITIVATHPDKMTNRCVLGAAALTGRQRGTVRV